jgi:pre-mRNA-splicing factor CDC5/CEF1
MPVVKGGVWTNIEDEILKASVSKYGLNQWARVSSLLARKTAKQCKARWTEWLDPSIRKTEWSKEEDEKLLHLAKLFPTQWRTIAPMVGRTATQCLERYQRLLDEAEARENDELGLGGPEGGETAAPTGDEVRRLRPGELDPDPESKPARPDTIDLDEDEKEMLSEARARLANTQGKKAKRKARERQLEESRRLAVLQKRRELKNAGINIKITHKKKGEMDYNADVPFEKAPAAGFYDTLDEQAQNEKERQAFDPRKQQLARKRQGDPEERDDPKRQKMEKEKSLAAAAARAGQMAKLREVEQQSRRRALNLPAPQVSDAELEDIIKMGVNGDRAIKASGIDEDRRSLVSNYNSMVGSTPIRTPRAPAAEDHIANEIRNIRALTDTQSSLLGGENTPLHTGAASTGFEGVAPRRNDVVTPNPMATPFRQSQTNGANGVSVTPLRTPRDNYALNNADQQIPSQTPAEQRKADNLHRQTLRAKLASLPKPKATNWELELDEPSSEADDPGLGSNLPEDQEDIDAREHAARQAAAAAEFKRQTIVYQRSLPRPRVVDFTALSSKTAAITDPIQALIASEAALLMAHDARKFPLPNSRVTGNPLPLENFSDDVLATARAELAAEVNEADLKKYNYSIETYYRSLDISNDLPSIFPPKTTPIGDYALALTAITESLTTSAQEGLSLESQLKKLHTGYINRSRALAQKLNDTYHACEEESDKLVAFTNLKVGEEAGLMGRLERVRGEVQKVQRAERMGQEEYLELKEKLGDLKGRSHGEWVNGVGEGS